MVSIIGHAVTVLDLGERVACGGQFLKERGLISPCLGSFVVARTNRLRLDPIHD